MGLTLMRALVEEARYVREGSTNVLRLVELAAVFRSVRELDEYLDVMQKKALEEPE